MNISILGCGWLGFPLAKELIKTGHEVKGSTTSLEKITTLQAEGIVAYQIQLFEEGILGDLSAFLDSAEVLVINIPPGLRKNPNGDFVKKTQILEGYLEKSAVEKVLFVSSTSVYEDSVNFPVYCEKDIPNGTAQNSVQLAAAEGVLISSTFFSTTVLRFGGLIGAGRHPVNSLTGRAGIKDPKAPVNLIHLGDCIKIIKEIIEQQVWGETFNAVYPEHPAKEEYYKAMAKNFGVEAPQFDADESSKGKIVDAVKLKEMLDFSFSCGIY